MNRSEQLNENLIAENNSSQTQIITYQEDVPLKTKIQQSLDIFSFIPVPKTSPISTKRSITGSLILLVIFFGYVIFSLVSFFVANYPRMNQFQEALGQQEVQVPLVAFAFVNGENLDQTLYNSQYFTFKFEMVHKVAGEKDKKPPQQFGPQYCGDLSWIGAPYDDKSKFQLWCPNPENQKDYIMKGLLYASPEQIYPRITVQYCNPQTQLLFCKDKTQLFKQTSGGRLYLFSEQAKSVNYATGKQTSGKENFDLNYYFLVPGDYNRAELVMQETKTTIFPDYLTSFLKKEEFSLTIASQNFYISDVTYNNPALGFQLWMRLDDNVQNVDVVYDTIITYISQWGAFWGVLFAGFAFYFLKYNTNKFYKKNQDWANFDRELQKVEVIQRQSYEGPQQQTQEEQDQQNNQVQNRPQTQSLM